MGMRIGRAASVIFNLLIAVECSVGHARGGQFWPAVRAISRAKFQRKTEEITPVT